MAGTGNGVGAVVETASQPTGAGSAPSTRRGRPRTKPEPLGLAKRLEILEQAVIDFQAEGGDVDMFDLGPDMEGVAITLKRVGYCPHCSRLMAGRSCPRCHPARGENGQNDAAI